MQKKADMQKKPKLQKKTGMQKRQKIYVEFQKSCKKGQNVYSI